MIAYDDRYDETLTRFRSTGPEFEDGLSNHGPMAVEALVRRNSADIVPGWTDDYVRRLDARPTGIRALDRTDWRDGLGDEARRGDWLDAFEQVLADEPWRDVLARWWPRLLPGIAAGATHGVIRVGHAVTALAEQDTAPRRMELAHGLAHWASRYREIHLAAPRGTTAPEQALSGVPAVAEQGQGIGHRLEQLGSTPGYDDAVAAAGLAGDAAAVTASIADAAVAYYATHAHGNATMLVHAATAPNAVSLVIPHLPATLHEPSVAAAWNAATAVVAAYRPAQAAPRTDAIDSASDLWQRSAQHGSEHVIKFADTALRSYERTGDPVALSAIDRAIALDA